MNESGKGKALILILAGQALIGVLFVFFRIIDGDEGFYLAAAQRVADGMTLYADFFYPQMPLLPLVFSPLAGWGIGSLLVLRLLATGLGLLLTYWVYIIVDRTIRDRKAALTAAFLVAFSGILFAWHSTFKPYVFVDLLLLFSFGSLLQLDFAERFSYRHAFFAALMLSVAFNFRSIFVILAPLWLFFILRALKGKNGNYGIALLWSLIGLALPTIPSVILWLKAPANFWFNNLIFHLYREPIEPFSALVWHKLTVLGKFIVLPQSILLIGSAFASFILLRLKQVENHKIYKYAVIMATIIACAYLIPTPIHLQYFQQTIPYLTFAALPAIVYVGRQPALKRILKSGAILYLLGVLPFVYFFMLVPHARDKRFEWPHLRSVIGQIQKYSAENDTVLSEWAGYAALSDRAQLPGSEHVGFYFPLKVEKEQYRRNHLLTNDDIVSALAQKRPELVVIDFKIYPEWQQALVDNYHLAFNTSETFVYQRNHDTL